MSQTQAEALVVIMNRIINRSYSSLTKREAFGLCFLCTWTMRGFCLIFSEFLTFILANPILTDIDGIKGSKKPDNVAFPPILPDLETEYSG